MNHYKDKKERRVYEYNYVEKAEAYEDETWAKNISSQDRYAEERLARVHAYYEAAIKDLENALEKSHGSYSKTFKALRESIEQIERLKTRVKNLTVKLAVFTRGLRVVRIKKRSILLEGDDELQANTEQERHREREDSGAPLH